MSAPSSLPVFDGHNDQLSMLDAAGIGSAVANFKSNESAAIDSVRARIGGFAGGLFAVWVPSPGQDVNAYDAMSAAPFDVPLPPEVPWTTATAAALSQMAIPFLLERAGLVRVCRTVPEIRSAIADGVMALVIHMEGAEAIGPDLAALEVFHAAGLRSLGPVWSRPNRFGHGVPFRFPASPDTGPGLTALGRDLVRRCNTLKIMIDLSHLNERGFWDVAERSTRPLVATHSNAHALCPTTRNLTDQQLDAIAQSDGMVGVNFATGFLREDGRMDDNVPLSRILDHVDYLLARLGENRVGFGSDYDGALVPAPIKGVEHLPRLMEAMAYRGYSEALMAKLAHENWLRVLAATWDP